MNVLAIDQGGHASRALVFDRLGNVLARGMCEVSEQGPAEDEVEQDPEELVTSIRLAVERACAELAGGRTTIACAGLATQRSSIVAWDKRSGEALTPVISWQDRRAAAWMRPFQSRATEIRARTGLFPSPHYGASKMRWCLDHVPEVASARSRGTLCLGPLASFLVFRLCREHAFVVDPAHASRTLLWNLATRDWDSELMDLFGVPRECLPRCVPTRGEFGTLLVDEHAIPLVVVNGDQSCAIFARGEPRPDTAYVNLGTGAFVQRPQSERPADIPRLLTSLVLGDERRSTFVVEGTVNGAGSALQWIAKERRLGDIEGRLAGWLSAEQDPPLFLNGVSGLGAPFWVSDFSSRFIGEGSDPAAVVAVLESSLFLVQRILDEMRPTLGSPTRLQVSGGLAELDAVCVRLASLSGIAVERAREHEATAKGLAWLASGDRDAWIEAEPCDRFESRHEPRLASRHARWKRAMDEALGRTRA